MSEQFCIALSAWKTLLGEARVSETNSSYRLAASSKEDVVGIVKIASQHSVPIYPISRGKNWGYGGETPPNTKSVIVDLSRMNSILSIDRVLGLITVEPGVTIGQVQEFLTQENIPFMAPSVGSGPEPSMIGNALERGTSGTPPIDRFSSLMSLKAVLADGTTYESSSSQKSESFFKWGVGPYLDGLFGQSGFGIVVEATFALAPVPESVKSFYIGIKADSSLPKVIDAMRESLQTVGGILPYISLTNAERIVSRNRYYDRKNTIAHWAIVGSLQGTTGAVNAAHKKIKSMFRAHIQTTLSLPSKKKSLFWLIRDRLPKSNDYLIIERLLESIISETTGQGKSEMRFLTNTKTSFEGLLFAPAVFPIKGNLVAAFIENTQDICKTYNIPFPVSFFNFSDQCLYMSLLLKFDPSNEEEKLLAHDCYREIKKAAENHGGYFYRASSSTMDTIIDSEHVFWKTSQKIKASLDPKNIIAPGRYNMTN